MPQGAPEPENEVDRHAALCRLGILDTEEDQRFNDITQLVRLSGRKAILDSGPCSLTPCDPQPTALLPVVHCQQHAGQ